MNAVDQATFIEVLRGDEGLKAEARRRLALREKARLGIEIAATAVRVRRLLRRLGLPQTLRRLRGDVPASPRSAAMAPGDHLTAMRLGTAVRKTLRILPGDTRCLTQSLVLTRLLARRGVGTRLVIAVAPGEDFAAHAWLEHGGEPLLPAEGSGFGRLIEL